MTRMYIYCIYLLYNQWEARRDRRAQWPSTLPPSRLAVSFALASRAFLYLDLSFAIAPTLHVRSHSVGPKAEEPVRTDRRSDKTEQRHTRREDRKGKFETEGWR
jgi:hypothetical protein